MPDGGRRGCYSSDDLKRMTRRTTVAVWKRNAHIPHVPAPPKRVRSFAVMNAAMPDP
jgi:hypothetical protein